MSEYMRNISYKHIMKKNYNKLIGKARAAMKNAKPDFSNFHVGAALLTTSGKIITGCNIESASYSLTICAERNAIFKAVSEKETKFIAIAITSDSDDFCSPCGACRQVIYEQCGDIDVVMINSKKEILIKKITELLPMAFSKKDLRN